MSPLGSRSYHSVDPSPPPSLSLSFPNQMPDPDAHLEDPLTNEHLLDEKKNEVQKKKR